MIREELLNTWNSLKLKLFQYKSYFDHLELKTFEFDIFASVATFPEGKVGVKYQVIEASNDYDRTLTANDVEGGKSKKSNLDYMLLHVYRVRGIVKEVLYLGNIDNNKGDLNKVETDKLRELGEILPFPIASKALDSNDSDDDPTIEEVD